MVIPGTEEAITATIMVAGVAITEVTMEDIMAGEIHITMITGIIIPITGEDIPGQV
ncbi:hypothetical protein SDC9_142671 [bioreactor metagenome]|uniref:Uncharacterized protein n=1 Tax=bioreactor metagenome TaxID=1076179 RepID=A0A645E1S7_9ZZZZ